MRLARFLIAVAALSVAAHRADAQRPIAQPGAISVAWPAPIGHSQPRADDIPSDLAFSPSLEDREFDAKLKICRGC
jgi:hypothetical protein